MKEETIERLYNHLHRDILLKLQNLKRVELDLGSFYHKETITSLSANLVSLKLKLESPSLDLLWDIYQHLKQLKTLKILIRCPRGK